MRAGLISSEQLAGVRIFAEAQERISADAIQDRTIRRTRTAKAIIDKLVGDCLEASRIALAQANVRTIEEIYATRENLILLSQDSDTQLIELEAFLMQNFYLHDSLRQTADRVRQWLGRLFETLCKSPERMPRYFQRFIPEQGLQRAVCDYIAGMTDRFCLKTLENM